MGEARWEWQLLSGERIAATIDPTTGTESVLVGDRVVSQCARGAKAEGHVLSPSPGIVSFDPRILVCILRIDGEEVTPSKWPVPERKPRQPPPASSLPSGLALVAALVVVAALALFFLRGRSGGGGKDREITGVHRSGSGLFVAHFPPSFTEKPAIVPGGATGLTLVDEENGDAIVIVALSSPDAPRDTWLLHKRLHGEALANVPRADGHYEELARRDEACLGQPGAVVVGRVMNRRREPARVWSCAVTHDGTGYLLMSLLREDASSADGKRVRRVIDATELTRLGQVGSSSPPP